MYGQSGTGGMTGSQGGGSAASGSAAAPMDIGNSVQAGLMAAQMRNLDADTNEKNQRTKTGASIEGKNIKELDVMAADIKSKMANTENATELAELNRQKQEVEAAKVKLTETQTGLVGEQTETQKEVTGIKQTENEVAWATKEDQKAIVQEEAKLQALKGQKTKGEIEEIAEKVLVAQLKQAEQKAGIALTNAQREAIWDKVWQGWVNTGFNGLTTIIKGISQFKPNNKTVKSYKEGNRGGKEYWEQIETSYK